MRNGNDGKIAIIVAVIGAVATITAAFIGVKWGNSNIMVSIDGKNVTLNQSELAKLSQENQNLKTKILNYKNKIDELKSKEKDLAKKLYEASEESEDLPLIEYKNCGLSINGDEKEINQEKSYVSINNRQYFSRDFIENLVSDNMEVSMKGEMLYIGKVIKEKTSLLDMTIIDSYGGEIEYGITDTYGNKYTDVLCFGENGTKKIFNVKREYSNFKCTIAMEKNGFDGGSIKIKTDDKTVYTSPEITSLTEPFEIDIPINEPSKLTIEGFGEDTFGYIFIANAILYN